MSNGFLAGLARLFAEEGWLFLLQRIKSPDKKLVHVLKPAVLDSSLEAFFQFRAMGFNHHAVFIMTSGLGGHAVFGVGSLEVFDVAVVEMPEARGYFVDQIVIVGDQ
jgi:hypothetical protein